MSINLRRAAGAVLAGALLTAAAAQSSDPFFEHTLELSHAYGLEMAGQRLTVLEAFDAPIHEDLLEQVEKMLGRDAPRFAGTLAERDPELAAELLAAFEAVEEAAENGEDATQQIGEARALLDRAYETLIDADLRESATFKSAVMADLLLADDGVAEAYEDAAEEELWEYPNGWAALQRVGQLWDEVAADVTPEQKADGDEMIEFMAGIYPTAQPPEAITGSPEEAEAPAHRMVGILEGITDASLVPGRDLPRLAGHLADTLAPSCQAYAEGRDAVGVEGVYAVRNHYRKHLRRLLDLVAPDVHERATERLDGLISSQPPQPAADACNELIEALQEARSALGG